MGSSLGFADEKTNVLAHDDVSVDAKAKAAVHLLKAFSKICLLASAANRDGGDNNRKLPNGFARVVITRQATTSRHFYCGELGHFNCGMTTFTFSLDMQSELWEAHPSSAT